VELPPPAAQASAPPELSGLFLDPLDPADFETIVALQARLVDLAETTAAFAVLLDVPPGLPHRRILDLRPRFGPPPPPPSPPARPPPPAPGPRGSGRRTAGGRCSPPLPRPPGPAWGRRAGGCSPSPGPCGTPWWPRSSAPPSRCRQRATTSSIRPGSMSIWPS